MAAPINALGIYSHMADSGNSTNQGTTASPPSPLSSKGRTFLKRLGSSVVLWSFVLGALFSGNTMVSDILFLIVMLVIAGLGLEEFYELVEKAGFHCFRAW